MKKYKYILLFFVLFNVVGCTSILDTSPKDILTEEVVWKNKNAILAFLGDLYDRIQLEDFNYAPGAEAAFLSQYTDEAVRAYGWGAPNDPTFADNLTEIWNYEAIREVNVFLENVSSDKVNESGFNKVEISALLGEAKFIRAFYYFALVKRYGGMPLVTKPLDVLGDKESTLIPRSTEEATYEFIKTELDEIIDNDYLPASRGADDRYRATKYAALALKSRAMLYAGTIAKYGTVELNGLVGIAPSKAAYFLQESKKASEEIMKAGFGLYDANSDKTANFQELFLDRTMHKEAIFKRAFESPNKAHSFDYYNAAQSFRVDYGNVINPVYEMAEEFEYIDGTPGVLKVSDANGDPIKYQNPLDLFKNKDPRFRATIMVPFENWQGSFVEVRRGIVSGATVVSAPNTTDLYPTDENAKYRITVVGRDGTLDVQDPTKTGFYIKKFMNPTDKVPYSRSETHWTEFRFAETLLNYAEASIELGTDKGKALDAVNEIRTRAGIKELQDLTLDKVRHERKIELAFENHRWWDMKRWRVADKILDNKRFYSLNPYLVWEEGKNPHYPNNEMSYIFKKEPSAKQTRTFLPKNYYVKIPNSNISTNPMMEQNPQY